jgi:hypothetical protein
MSASSVHAFTVLYDHIENTLSSRVKVDSPFNPQTMSPPDFQREFIAVWDTGATNSVISRSAATLLNLKPISYREVQHGGGKENCLLYLVSMLLPHQIIFPHVEVIESNISSCDLLIGMDIINQGDLAVSNYQNETAFTFRMPSIQRLDFSSDKTS